MRLAVADDACRCAGIVNAWIDQTEWMPRKHAHDDVERYYRDVVFKDRTVWVSGKPVDGFLAFEDRERIVTALYTALPGTGRGKALLDHVKERLTGLRLWTFVANEGARRFYAREGFCEVERTEGDNEEGLPDVCLSWDRHPIRSASAEDAALCARIVSDWVDRTPWMSRSLSPKDLQDLIAEALPNREIFLIGDPPEGYLSLNPETGQIGALYLDQPGQGLGKALMDRAKQGRDYLQLWTHAPNEAAHRFYVREGFHVVEQNPKGGDGLAELRMEWHR